MAWFMRLMPVAIAFGLFDLVVNVTGSICIGAEALTAPLQGHEEAVSTAFTAELECVGSGISVRALHGAQISVFVIHETTDELCLTVGRLWLNDRGAAVFSQVVVVASIACV